MRRITAVLSSFSRSSFASVFAAAAPQESSQVSSRALSLRTSAIALTGIAVASPLEQFELLSSAAAASGSAAALPRLWGGVTGALGFSSLSEVLTALSAFGLLLAAAVVRAPALAVRSWSGAAGELLVRGLKNFLVSNATLAQQGYVPVFAVLVLSLAAFNLAGVAPFGFTVTSHIGATLFYAFTVFFGLNFIALARYGRTFFGIFAPAGTPFALLPLLVLLEFVSYAVRPLSLSIRLFANMLAGHALLKILVSFAFRGLTAGNGFALAASLLGLTLIGAVLLLEFAVALLQVFVFATLFALYLVDVHTVAH